MAVHYADLASCHLPQRFLILQDPGGTGPSKGNKIFALYLGILYQVQEREFGESRCESKGRAIRAHRKVDCSKQVSGGLTDNPTARSTVFSVAIFTGSPLMLLTAGFCGNPSSVRVASFPFSSCPFSRCHSSEHEVHNTGALCVTFGHKGPYQALPCGVTLQCGIQLKFCSLKLLDNKD